jgi:hypothetical protein
MTIHPKCRLKDLKGDPFFHHKALLTYLPGRM